MAFGTVAPVYRQKIMRLISCLFIVGLFFCTSCSSNGQVKPKSTPVIQYNFPNQDACSMTLEEQCFSDPEDYSFYMGSELESVGLSAVEIDIATERQIGKQFHDENNFDFVDDQRLATLEKILGKMKSSLTRKEIDYQVFVVQSGDINAWTVPGGYIYFTTAILDFAKNEDELANILGHEIGHNECKHTHKHLQRAALAQLPMQLFGFDADPSFFVNIYNTVVISFGQHEELESDRTGFKLSAAAGYDPLVGLDFWKRMAEMEQKNRFQKFFRSHPYSSERYDCGENYINNYSSKK